MISGSGATLSVVGTHTYADPGTAVVRVTIVDKLGLGLTASTLSAAIIVTLGKTAGKSNEAEFWHKTAGQNLILAFNGGAAHTELSAWLATSFPNLYGATAGSANLTGKTNADVAAYFQGLWKANPDGAAVEVLTTALNVYATTTSLGGGQAASYGLKLTSYGLGAMTFNVGKDGIAFGVPDKTKLYVFEMLRIVDQQAVNGVLFGGNRLLERLAGDAFEGLNSI